MRLISRRAVVVALVLALGVSMLGRAAAAQPPSAPAVEQTSATDHSVLVFHRTTGFRHESIEAAIAAIEELGADHGFGVDDSQDQTVFTDEGLAPYSAIVFITDGENILNPSQRTAFERYIHRGGGFVGIHSASNMHTQGDWPWYEDLLGGAFFVDHPPIQTATMHVEDPDHPATSELPAEWEWTDEWYNFAANPRDRDVHVLLTVDEGTYNGGTMGEDHPIAWCSNYDGGRAFYTAIGHQSSHYADASFRSHLLGGIQWAAGVADADCGDPREGPPTDAAFEKVTLDNSLTTPANPMKLDITPDGRVIYTELGGTVKIWHPDTQAITVAAQIPVFRAQENGLLGIALDPDFETNQWVYLFYSAPSPQVQHVSRFTMDGDTIDLASEVVLLEIPHQRVECCHSSGDLEFDSAGNLYISTGDDTNPFASDGSAPIDFRDGRQAWDAARSAGNTADLRGKILRITPLDEPGGTPGPGSTYTVPDDNLFTSGRYDHLFPGGVYDPQLGRPEIYTMGHRNPFTIAIDPYTDDLWVGDVGPDAQNNTARGPRGYDEWNLIQEAGNHGWPFCIADSQAYSQWPFPNGPAGDPYDCDSGPANNSPNNTGLPVLPPATDATIYYPYGPSDAFPELPTGQGRAAFMGDIYQFDPDNLADGRFPEYYDGAAFIMEWSRNWIGTVRTDEDGGYVPDSFEEFMPLARLSQQTQFRSPHDMKFGPDGNMYVIEWGIEFNFAGGGINPDAGLYRISFVKGTRTPVARATADPDSGQAPLTVSFSSEGSLDPDGDDITFDWDLGDGTSTDEQDPTHTYTQPGVYAVQLTVTDETGRASSANLTITVGNTRPEVTIEFPPHGGFFDWGDDIPFEVSVVDAEDGSTTNGTIECEDVTTQTGLWHDEGDGAHVHPGPTASGCDGSIPVSADADHGPSADIATTFTASYTDRGGEPGSQPLTGAVTHLLQPKRKQARFFDSSSGGLVTTAIDDPESPFAALTDIDDGDWVSYDPVNLLNIDALSFRVASNGPGGQIEVRKDAADGELLATADVADTGAANNWVTVTVDVDDPGDTFEMFLVFTGEGSDLFRLSFFEVVGQGLSAEPRPRVAITQPHPADAFDPGEDITITAEASDPAGSITSVEFLVDDEPIGTATSEPFTAVLEDASEGFHVLRAVATNDAGRSTTSHAVRIFVGDPRSASDDFSGDELDLLRWNRVVRHDPDGVELSDGWLRVESTPLDIFGGLTGLPNIVLQTAPPGDWTIMTKMNAPLQRNWQNAGLMVYEDDDNYLKFGFVATNQPGQARNVNAEVVPETNGAPTVVNDGAPNDVDDWWLRLTKVGDTYTPEWSVNGTTWTAMSQSLTIELDDPAFGLYVTGSDQQQPGQQITVSWDCFELVGEGSDACPEPDDPDPDPEPQLPCDDPDVPRTITDTFDDELDGCRWDRVVRYDPDSLEVADGRLLVDTSPQDIFGGANTNPTNMIFQTAPAGDWTIETRMDAPLERNFQNAGFMVYDNDDNYLKFGIVATNQPGQPRTLVAEMAAESNAVPNLFGDPVDGANDDWWLRLTKTGNTYAGEWSTDGETWTPLSQTRTITLANPAFGLYAVGTTNQTQPVTIGWDHFELVDEEPPEPDPEPDCVDPQVPRTVTDSFEDDDLDGCRWDRVVRYAPDTLELADGWLRVDSSPQDIFGTNNTSPTNLVFQTAPDGDWTIETRMNAPLERNFQNAGFMVYDDDDNYLKMGIVATNEPGAPRNLAVEMLHEVGGQPSFPFVQDPDAPDDNDDWWLRLTKEDNSYSGAWSVDGESWTDLPDSRSIELDDPAFGLYVVGTTLQTQPVTVSWDYFELAGEVEDPVACDGTITIGGVDSGVPDRAVEEQCVTDLIATAVATARNRGQFKKQVDAIVAELVESEVLTPTEAKAVSKAAAKSKIGGPGGP